jgi:hypothetical protein
LLHYHYCWPTLGIWRFPFLKSSIIFLKIACLYILCTGEVSTTISSSTSTTTEEPRGNYACYINLLPIIKWWILNIYFSIFLSLFQKILLLFRRKLENFHRNVLIVKPLQIWMNRNICEWIWVPLIVKYPNDWVNIIS